MARRQRSESNSAELEETRFASKRPRGEGKRELFAAAALREASADEASAGSETKDVAVPGQGGWTMSQLARLPDVLVDEIVKKLDAEDMCDVALEGGEKCASGDQTYFSVHPGHRVKLNCKAYCQHRNVYNLIKRIAAEFPTIPLVLETSGNIVEAEIARITLLAQMPLTQYQIDNLREEYGDDASDIGYESFISLEYSPETNEWSDQEWAIEDEEVITGDDDTIDPNGPKFRSMVADMMQNADVQMLEIRLENPPDEPYTVPDAFRRLFRAGAVIEPGKRSMGGKDRDQIIEIEEPFA